MTMEKADYWSTKPIRSSKENEFLQACLPYLVGNEALLDLGCGRGLDALAFAKHGCTVTALDLADANIEHTCDLADKAGVEISPVRHDLSQRLPFDDDSFDAIYAHLSIHYFDDAMTKAIIDDMYRILKPSGLLFVKCKSTKDSLYGQGKKVGHDMYVSDHLRHFFSPAYMRECLEGFDILTLEETESTYNEDYPSAYTEAIARKRSE